MVRRKRRKPKPVSGKKHYMPKPIRIEGKIRSMPALTIHAPFAQLIMLPETDERHKRIENRPWKTSYRGRFAIHCSKSKKAWREYDWGIPESDIAWGCVIGFAQIRSCTTLARARQPYLVEKRPALILPSQEQHARGPYCWFLKNINAAVQPIPARGQQRWWTWTYEMTMPWELKR